MRKIALFGGTAEARLLAGFLAEEGADLIVCVATGYGRDLIDAPNVRVLTGRMGQTEMERLLREGLERVIDATHPYAAEATANIKAAANNTGVPYIRLERPASNLDGCRTLPSAAAAVEYLKGTTGNILLTTGSNELPVFTRLPDYKRRIYLRVLPFAPVLEECAALGFLPGNILAMQGAFDEDFNRALLRHWQIKTLVSKDGGKVGGFEAKRRAAAALGVELVVIVRPPQEPGIPYAEMVAELKRWLKGAS